MSFQTALAGLTAASSDLRVTGHNIANASTIGFKRSRAEFGDVYAASVLGSGSSPIGSGVKLANVAQQFDQGTITFTDNSLDLAIDGNGFFVLSNGGARKYTRAGVFGVDRYGHVVSNSGARLQGFGVTASGSVGGTLGDLVVSSDNQQPRATTLLTSQVNLDARAQVLARQGHTFTTTGAAIGVARAGTVATANNGYGVQSLDVVDVTGTVTTVTTVNNASAAEIATSFANSSLPGITADASSTARIVGSAFNNASGTLSLQLNNVQLTGSTLVDVAASINAAPGLSSITATVDAAGDLVINDSVGNDIVLEISAGIAGDSVGVIGPQGAAVTISPAGNNVAVVGGSVDISLDEGITVLNPQPANVVFGTLNAGAFTPFVVNAFDPNDPETYNAATSVTVFDSLGNPHTLSQYFVRERSAPSSSGQARSLWTMYALIDGRDVGDPDVNLAPPANMAPTRSGFRIEFNPDGTLNQAGTEPMLISNWVPLDANGQPNGALGPRTVLNGGTLPVAQPTASSNFEIRVDNSTQYGSPFGVNVVDQNGFTTGRLSGIDIDPSGIIFARYTNGQNQPLGQVALAAFANTQGLAAAGESSWVETVESGEPLVGSAGTASLGVINSGALEDSNVDLSEQLVALIVAQRNYQANARTITANDELTTAVINI
jgi:flagellar hook protein FlgE